MNNNILKNASEIIYETGLLKNEVVQLNIDNVKQNGSIVSSIQPVSGPYTKGFQKAPIIVSNNARNVFANHVNCVNSIPKFNSPASPLFHNLEAGSRYEERKLLYALPINNIQVPSHSGLIHPKISGKLRKIAFRF